MLGHLRIRRHGTEVGEPNWPTSKTRDLLAYMVHCGEAVSRDKLLGSLWPDVERESATGLLHTTVYYLRRVLEGCGLPGLVVYGNKHYRLAEHYGNDRDEYLDLLAAGLGPGDSLNEQALAGLERAVKLYRGHYLEELNYSWLLPLREVLKQKHVDARERLAGYYLENNEFSRAIDHLLVAEEINPFAEQVHLLLMRAFAGQGDRQAAHGQYRKMASCLQTVGLSPSMAAVELYASLMRR